VVRRAFALAAAHGIAAAEFWDMTLADLAVAIKQRAMARAREQVTLAWRTAYYHRVKHMPDLTSELAEIGSPDDALEGEVDARGNMSAAREARLWTRIKTGVLAWNARLAADGIA
jgi:hypothetical protein